MRKEEIILSALTKDSDFVKKVMPHMQADFFQDRKEKIVFQLIDEFYTKYQKLPTRDVLNLELEELKNVPESEFDDTKEVLKSAFVDSYEYEPQWLLDETEKFCKERAVYNAIMQSVMIINGEDKRRGDGEIPKMLQDALAISFDNDIGHDYFRNARERFDFYHRKENRIPCSIDLLNKVTDSGLPRKCLAIAAAMTGGGKSLFMCSLASDYLKQGLNVLYITLELAEERVAERIDANLFNTPIQNLKDVDLDSFMTQIDFLKSKTHGTLKIKEYPPSTVSAANFRLLIDDLKQKEDFVPDVCFVDYLGITASARYKGSANVNSYTIQKAVAEELRAIAVEYNMLLWTAVQTNRSGFNASDFDLENISDSSGPSMSADFMLGIIRTPELDELNQTMIKQLKNRFGALDYYRKFVVGIDRSRMRIYNVEESAQSNITQDVSDSRSNQAEKPSLDRYSKAKKTVNATDEWEF